MTTALHAARIPADTFANRLMLSRALAGHLSIREAAEQCGLGRGAWQNWEKGARPDDYQGLVKLIAGRLGIDEEWLREGGALLPAESPARPARWAARGYKDISLHRSRPRNRPTTRPVVGRPPNRPVYEVLPPGQRRPAKVRP